MTDVHLCISCDALFKNEELFFCYYYANNIKKEHYTNYFCKKCYVNLIDKHNFTFKDFRFYNCDFCNTKLRNSSFDHLGISYICIVDIEKGNGNILYCYDCIKEDLKDVFLFEF